MKYCLNAACSIFILLWSITAWAQGENTNWMFGHNTRLNFSTSPPTMYQSNMQCWEGGSISFSDASGNLIFYSNGNNVWNANGDIMNNGDHILGNGPTATPPYGYPCSSSQGVNAIQSIANPLQYYLFALDAMEDGPPYSLGRLRYSIIDMSLDGGLGDVIAGRKNIMLDDSMTEKMTVVKAGDCGFWLLTHKMYTKTYSAFKIDATGLHTTPVFSSGALVGELGYGMLHASPDGKILVMTAVGSNVELCTFDNITGTVSNAGYFSSTGGKIGTCISQDNTKLYVGHYNKLSQYDLTAFPDMTAVIASEEIISTNITFGQMRRSPDNKIYIANVNASNIAIIENPNGYGTGCNYNLNGMSRPLYTQFPAIPSLPPAAQYGSGLGQEVTAAGNMLRTTVRSVKDTLICGTNPITLAVPSGFGLYTWNTQDTVNAISVTEPGTYWVKSIINCDAYIDTFHVTAVDYNDWHLAHDTAICPGDALIIDAYSPDATAYSWQDGSTDPTFTATDKGSYTATVHIKGCALTDTINVSVMDPYLYILERDTVICRYTGVLLHAVSFPEGSYLWNNGSAGPQLLANNAGTYSVQVTNVCGVLTDAVKVDVVSCDCNVFVPNAFSPNGDGRNDFYEIGIDCPKLMSFELSIYNRFGQEVFKTNSSTNGWNGYFKGIPADVGTYFFYLRYKTGDQDIAERKGNIDLIR